MLSAKSVNINEIWHKTSKLVLVLNVVCLLYLFFLAYYNRLAYDDNSFSYIVQNNGVLGFVEHMYLNWQGRFAGFFLLGLLYEIVFVFDNLFFVTVLLIVLGVLSFYRLTYYVLKDLGKYTVLNIATLLFCVLVISAYDFNTFYWLCATIYYLITFALVLLVAELITSNQKMSSYVIIAVISFYVGGAAEHIAALYIILVGFWLAYKLLKNRGNPELINKTLNKKLLVSLVFCSVAFLILYFAPGNNARIAYYEQSSLIMLLPYSIKAFFKLLFFTLVKSYYFLFVLPFAMLLGIYFRETGKSNPFSPLFPNTTKKVFYYSLFVVVFVFLSVIPGVYATTTLFPVRAGVHVTLIILFYTFILGFYLGYRSKPAFSKTVNLLSTFGLLSLFFLIVFFLIVEVPLVKQYSKSDMERKEFLLTLQDKGNKDLILLHPLDNPGYENILFRSLKFFGFENIIKKPGFRNKQFYFRAPLKVNEISTDPRHWSNRGLKRAYGLEFDIARE